MVFPASAGVILALRTFPQGARITPADAGKTIRRRLDFPTAEDHPRGCGENPSILLFSDPHLGSPPRMRGKQICVENPVPSKRITPADAGKTFAACLSEEHILGSPPRMRGKLYTAVTPCTCARITPADAGKTLETRLSRTPCEDHPRGCGENAHRKKRRYRWTGSPPRMRGKLSALGSAWTNLGITPAGAGKTRCCIVQRSLSEDHPRRCGENPLCNQQCLCKQGSPPQVRGKLAMRSLNRLSPRITPAGAGKTRQTPN